MASTTPLLLSLLFLALSLSLSSVSARPGLHFHPCNTLIISSYSFSLLPQNPNSLPNHPQFILVASHLRPRFLHHRFIPTVQNAEHFQTLHQRPQLPLGFSSFKDRTKDILSVVASLLFGAACGALTAGTMYLIWSLFNHRHASYRSLDGFDDDDNDDDDDDDEDIFNPKKQGYVTVPAAPAVPAKETA